MTAIPSREEKRCKKARGEHWWAFGERPRGYVNDLINLFKANGSRRSRQRVSTQGERDVKNPP